MELDGPPPLFEKNEVGSQGQGGHQGPHAADGPGHKGRGHSTWPQALGHSSDENDIKICNLCQK